MGGLEVRERARGAPGLDEEAPEVRPGHRIVRVDPHGALELANRDPAVHGSGNPKQATEEIAVAKP